MKQSYVCASLLAIVFTLTSTNNVIASEEDGGTPPPSISINLPITTTSGSTASANAMTGPITNTATTGPATATANPVVNTLVGVNANPISSSGAHATGGAGGSATANPIVSPIISPTITGGNSAANVGNVTAGGATLNNIGSNNGANLKNIGNASVVDNSKTDIKVIGGATNATGTANVNVKVGDQISNNTVKVENGPITVSPIVNASGGKGGEASSSANVNNSGNSPSSSKAENGPITVSPSVVINNPKIPPPAAPIPQLNPLAPTLLFNKGAPANAGSVAMTTEFLNQCEQTLEKGVNVSEIRQHGDSGKTRVIFTPHTNYDKFKKSDVATRIQVVRPGNKTVHGKCTCIGMLQVEGTAKDAGEAPLGTIRNDAGIFGRDELHGFADIKLVLIPGYSVTVNTGVDANASGRGVSPGVSGLISTLLGTLGANFSSNEGQTFPAARVGETYIVIAGGEIPDGAASIDIQQLVQALSSPQK